MELILLSHEIAERTNMCISQKQLLVAELEAELLHLSLFKQQQKSQQLKVCKPGTGFGEDALLPGLSATCCLLQSHSSKNCLSFFVC